MKRLPSELRQEIIESLERGLGQELLMYNDMPQIYHPLEWHEILRMTNSGLISIGSHTCSHAVLPQCSPENKKRELYLSRQLIEKRTGLSCNYFSYPHGEFDGPTKNLLRKLGYLCGITTAEEMNDKSSDVFELKRLSIMTRGNLIEFAMIISGVTKLLSDIKQAIDFCKIRNFAERIQEKEYRSQKE